MSDSDISSPIEREAFSSATASESMAVPQDLTAIAVVKVGTFAFLTPLFLLPLIGADYDPYVRTSHVLIVLSCVLFWWALNTGRVAAHTVLYVLGAIVPLSNTLLLQASADVVDTFPSFLLMLISIIVPVPVGVIVLVVSISLANLVVAGLRFDFGLEIPTIMLIVVATLTLIIFTQMVRRSREAFYLRLRSEALEAARAIQASAHEAQALQQQVAQDEKLRSLGSLAGGVVHDLNNLLVPIVGNTDLVLKEGVAPEHAQALEEVLDAAERAADLTRELNAFAGGSEGPWERLDLAAEIREIQALVWRGSSERVEISTVYPETPVYVSADRAQLHQIVANLLSNAVEALEGKRRGVIELRVWADDTTAWFEVMDNGPGIPDVVRDRLFEPFQSTKGRGRGMGLAAVSGAVRRLGGDVGVETSETGTRMSVSLPKAAPPSERDAVASTETHDIGNVLLVDDEAHVRHAVVRLLESMGGTVSVARSGEDALDKLKTGLDPDVILMDVRMPGMGGINTLGRIREIYPSCPVVLCTGYARRTFEELETDQHGAG